MSGPVVSIIVPMTSLPILLGWAALVGLAWLPLCWWIGFTPEDRESFRGMFSRACGFVMARAG